MPSKIEYTTIEFEMSHQKRPYGFGQWAYKVWADKEIFPGGFRVLRYVGMYSETKKWAMQYARQSGAYRVVLQS